jgi:hypothetical protein
VHRSFIRHCRIVLGLVLVVVIGFSRSCAGEAAVEGREGEVPPEPPSWSSLLPALKSKNWEISATDSGWS